MKIRRPTHKWLRDEAGMSLVEILVVFAIIALLAALLIPALGSANAKARQVQCLSQMRQLTHAWYAYSTDYDGRLVRGYPAADGWVERCNTAAAIENGKLFPYTSNVRIYKCPFDKTIHNRSYSIGQYHNGESGWGGMTNPVYNRLSIPKPSTTYVFVEENDPRSDAGCGSGDDTYYNLGSFDIPVAGDCWIDFVPAFHRGGMNLSFGDGHTEYWRLEDPRTLALSGFFACTPGNTDLKKLQQHYLGW